MWLFQGYKKLHLHLLCISTRKWVLRMPFAGQNNFFDAKQHHAFPCYKCVIVFNAKTNEINQLKIKGHFSGPMGRSLDKTSKWASFSKFLVGGWVGGFVNRSWF